MDALLNMSTDVGMGISYGLDWHLCEYVIVCQLGRDAGSATLMYVIPVLTSLARRHKLILKENALFKVGAYVCSS